MNASSALASLPVLGALPRQAQPPPGARSAALAAVLEQQSVRGVLGRVAGDTAGYQELSPQPTLQPTRQSGIQPRHQPRRQQEQRSSEPWPIPAALERLLPGGLPRGATMAVTGSLSLLLATMGAASAEGAWCSLLGLPPVSAEAAREFGIAVERTPVVAAPVVGSGRAWTGLITALLDTIDVVAARPSAALIAGDLSRLSARARAKGATLLLYGDDVAALSGVDLRLSAQEQSWQRVAGPRGRLTARRITVTAQGRGRFGRPQQVGLWLPDRWGRIDLAEPVPVAESETGTVRSARAWADRAGTGVDTAALRRVGAR